MANSEDALEFDLGWALGVLHRRAWVAAAALCMTLGAAALYVFTATPIYRATALLLIEKEDRNKGYNEAQLSDTADDDYYHTQYRLLTSRTLLKRVYAEAGLSQRPEFASGVDALVAGVQVAPVVRSRLVNVSVESEERELAARLANAVTDAYVAQNVENKLFLSREVLRALYERDRPRSRAGVDADHASLPAVVNNPLIQQLKGSYAALEARYGELSSRYTAEHPERARLKSEMDALAARILDETRRIVESMKTQLSGQMLGNNVRVVDPAEPPQSPARPRKVQVLVLAALFGVALGVALCFTVENLDQTIRTQDDVHGRLGLALLGAVPRSNLFKGESGEEYYQLVNDAKSLTGESFKNIRTMLGFAAAGRELRTILVTSAVQGEGKTFLAINLALAFAQLGEKVLLIEGDLRRPNLHKRFGLSRENGLSSFLAHGEDVAELSALLHPAIVPNLSVLPCGPIPPNPSELLSLPRLKALMGWAKERFDHVIVDGTPVLPVSDAQLWGRQVDGGLFVVQFGGVRSAVVARAVEKLKEGGLALTGAVLNQVTAGGAGYGDYYYHYQYYTAEDKAPVPD